MTLADRFRMRRRTLAIAGVVFALLALPFLALALSAGAGGSIESVIL